MKAALAVGASVVVLFVAAGGFVAFTLLGRERAEPRLMVVDGKECVFYGDHSGYDHEPFENECPQHVKIFEPPLTTTTSGA